MVDRMPVVHLLVPICVYGNLKGFDIYLGFFRSSDFGKVGGSVVEIRVDLSWTVKGRALEAAGFRTRPLEHSSLFCSCSRMHPEAVRIGSILGNAQIRLARHATGQAK